MRAKRTKFFLLLLSLDAAAEVKLDQSKHWEKKEEKKEGKEKQ